MDFKCDELILGKKDADSRALTKVAMASHVILVTGIQASAWTGLLGGQ